MSGPAIPLGPFHLDRCIGRGGMAEVWSGVHAAQGVPVAVKVMTAERARESTFRAAFRNEVQAVASLDHPGIVRVFDHGEVGPEGEEASRGLLTAGSPILAMELADGTLAGHFAGGVTWPGLRQVLLGLLDALAHAHARGVVHRDLKPNNILVFRDGAGPALPAAGGRRLGTRRARPGGWRGGWTFAHDRPGRAHDGAHQLLGPLAVGAGAPAL